jgi:hypothetical protein
MRRRRILKWAKWASTLAAGLAVGVAVFSGFYWLVCFDLSRHTHARCHVIAHHGLFYFGRSVRSGVPDPPGWDEMVVKPSIGWDWGLHSDQMLMGDAQWCLGVLYSRHSGAWAVGVGLWWPVLLTVGPAAFLWYKDRRRFGPHACKKCGYDRSGLPADSPCPECGTVPARG